jgi:hypothetical protein
MVAATGGPLGEAKERRMGVRRAMTEVERAVAAPASGGRIGTWTEQLSTALESLHRAFDHHVAVTEGPDGLLEDVMSRAPRLAHRISLITEDHVSITEAIEKLHMSLLAAPVREEEVEGLSSSVFELLARIAHHRHLGADLVYEAYDVDIEAGD